MGAIKGIFNFVGGVLKTAPKLAAFGIVAGVAAKFAFETYIDVQTGGLSIFSSAIENGGEMIASVIESGQYALDAA